MERQNQANSYFCVKYLQTDVEIYINRMRVVSRVKMIAYTAYSNIMLLFLLIVTTIIGVSGFDEFNTMADICRENAFAHESYTVTSEDGYILSLHRIPGH